MTERTPDDPGGELIVALRDNNEAAVRLLLDTHPMLKATINQGTDALGFGSTPLIAAVRRGNRAMIEILLAAGADLGVKSDWWAGGFSVLESAEDDLVPFLVERGAVIDATAAAKFGMVDRLTQIVTADPGAVHQRSGDGKTPLHWAKDVATARFLIEHGADVNARDVDHESTAAQYAVRERPDVARYLVDAGSDVDIFLAAALGDLERARDSIDRDPRVVEMTVTPRDFPMHNPRAGGTIYIWTLGQGMSPQMVARAFGQQAVFDLLIERSPLEVQLAQACLLGDDALFNRFLAMRGTSAPLTPELAQQLVTAAVQNNASAVRLMLEAGWPVDAEGSPAGTALHWSAWHGNAGMMREILRHDPPLEFRDRIHDGTPLGWALNGSLHGWHAKTGDYGGVVTLLLEAGASATTARAGFEASAAATAALTSHRDSPG